MKKDKQAQKLQTVLWLVTVVAAILIIQICYYSVQGKPKWEMTSQGVAPETAVVMSITDVETTKYNYDDPESEVFESVIVFDAEVTKGENKGDTVVVKQHLDGFNPETNIKKVEVGDKVLVIKGYNLDEPDIYVLGEYLRSNKLIGLILVYFLALLIFGRGKGLNTIISISLTCAVIFIVFIPSILADQNIYLSSTLTCIYIIIMTLLIVNGYNRKTYVAVLGCISGVLVAGVLTLAYSGFMGLTGVVDQESIYLINLSGGIDMKSVVFAAIIIGSVGAIMDVAMSISAALHELCLQVEKPTFKMLLKSGLTIGRDMMGTMANTLILAYIGSFLTIVILFASRNDSLLQTLNQEMFVVEILQGVVGSFGILLTIPITSLLAAWAFPKMKNKTIDYSISPELKKLGELRNLTENTDK